MTQHLIYGILSILLFIQSAHADTVVLTSGERLDVTILTQDDDAIEVHHDILGDFRIDINSITSIERSDQTSHQMTDDELEEPAEEGRDADSWNQNIRLGLGLHQGQKETSDISTSYHADRTKEKYKISFDLSYRLSESGGEKTVNRFSSSWENTWFQTDRPWDIFTTLQFDWAEFQSWDQRVIGGVGIEYELLKYTKDEHVLTLSVRLGSGFRKEFQSEDDELIPEGLLGLLVDWSISDKQTLTADSTWYPDYEDTSNYRLVTNAGWNLQMDSSNTLQFSVGFHHEYNSVVDDGIEKSDLQLTAGIKYSF
jgi:putative salt-induced outer membrane protein YdiY